MGEGTVGTGLGMSLGRTDRTKSRLGSLPEEVGRGKACLRGGVPCATHGGRAHLQMQRCVETGEKAGGDTKGKGEQKGGGGGDVVEAWTLCRCRGLLWLGIESTGTILVCWVGCCGRMLWRPHRGKVAVVLEGGGCLPLAAAPGVVLT